MSDDSQSRTTIFISHATPGDNDFAVWLASRLAMAGYEVWCDQEKLLGGEDFWDEIDTAIRHRTIKFILVMSEKAFTDQGKLRNGIQKEVALAGTVGSKHSLENFIVPIRIDKVSYSDFPIDFHRLNGIDCSDNWATGLAKLLKVLERDSVPVSQGEAAASLSNWRAIHQHKSQAQKAGEELVQTNWLNLISMPETIHVYTILKSVRSSEPRAIAAACSLPCAEHARLLLSFADFGDLQWALGDDVPLKPRASIPTADFLRGSVQDIPPLTPADAKRKLSSLIRQGIEGLLAGREIETYEMAGQSVAYWFKPGMVEGDTLHFVDFSEKSRRRAVFGKSGKKKSKDDPEKLETRYFWHLGFTIIPTMSDAPSLAIKPRIIVSEDQINPLQNRTRLNSARRSITKMWFNDKWRGLVLGIAAWLSESQPKFRIPVGSGQAFEFNAIPETFTAPIVIATDPISGTLSDSDMESNDRAEFLRRLADPAFAVPEDEAEGEND